MQAPVRIVVASLAVVCLSGIATATPQAKDEHSKNIRQLAQVPIEIANKQFAQGSDISFDGNLLVAGTYEGIGLFRILPGPPYLRQISFFNCPASQGDVALLGDTVFVSIDSATSNSGSNPVCNNTDDSAGKEGIRVVDISNLRKPKQVAFVETDCGSHTHTLLPGGKRSYIYVQSYPLGAQTPTCSVASHRKVSIISFPTADPAKAKVAGSIDVSPQIGCHDVSVYPKRKIAGVACIGESQLWDISKPAAPQIISRIYNPSIMIHHSAAITWDGRYLALGDEFAGSVTGVCAGDSNSPSGAMWYYDIKDPSSPELVGYYNTPRDGHPSSADEAGYMACTTHNYGLLPMKNAKTYVATVPYRAAGYSVVDFSDPANPKEVGFYHQNSNGIPDLWAAYWYNGRIYASDNGALRGISVYEMDGLNRDNVRYFDGVMNPQTQLEKFQ